MPPGLPILLPLTLAAATWRPLSADVAWVHVPERPPTALERLVGHPVDARSLPTIREGDMVFDADSMAVELLAAMGAPLPALDHPPTPGVLFVAMDGVTLKPTCKGGQLANGALNCSPLVDKETVFPPVNTDNDKAAIFQKLSGYYADFDLVLSSNRPPDWLPYTMAVIGGTAGNAGYDGGVCGIANVACDGAKRNHVSLTFPSSCPGQASLTAGQETAHNWGLEHTDLASDIMYPFVAGATKFLDQCMDIDHSTGSGVTQCTYVHKLYCPEGDGEQQNSYGELMGVFGARRVDTVAPTIVSMLPEDGATLASTDAILVTANISDDSNFVGVKWTWVKGLPAELAESGYTACTNDVCDVGYDAWQPVDEPWDFIKFGNAPAGDYEFKLEVMDAYGNYATKSIAFTVVKEGGESAGETSGDETGDPEPTTSGGPTGEPTGAPTGDDSGGDPSSPTGLTGMATATMPDTSGEDADDGCGCRGPVTAPGLAALGLLALGRRRRGR
jgi:hypothetical protein